VQQVSQVEINKIEENSLSLDLSKMINRFEIFSAFINFSDMSNLNLNLFHGNGGSQLWLDIAAILRSLCHWTKPMAFYEPKNISG
jgi:hypothetical protein